jgi:cytochrome c oxidase subunit II
MADGTGPGRITLSGIAFGVLMLLLILASFYFFIGKPYWFPPNASTHGGSIDQVFGAVLLVTGIAFVIVQGLLGYFVARYGSQGNERAAYWHDNPKAEAILLIGTAVILTVLVFMGQRVWANIYFADRPENPLVVEVVGQQFNWNFRYPGADGAFGKIEPKFITGTDPFGLDPADPAGKDDVISIGELHIINNRPALFRLRSNDVIHSFFLPNYRVKQDSVPGMQIEIWMTPTTDNFTRNAFEVACAELCGLGHYKMRGLMTVDPNEEELIKWLQEIKPQ